MAYWQIAYPGSLRSSNITADYYTAQCQSAYGPTTFPDTVTFNKQYGGATPRVGKHRVFATQGSDDPWQPAGVQTTLSDTYLESTATCDGCSHCNDLRGPLPTDSAATTNQRAAVMSQMVSWVRDSSNPPMSPGVIAGIAVGTLALIALGVGVFLWRTRTWPCVRPAAAAPVVGGVAVSYSKLDNRV